MKSLQLEILQGNLLIALVPIKISLPAEFNFFGIAEVIDDDLLNYLRFVVGR